MIEFIIQVTVLYECPFWVGIFERKDDEGYAVARQIFGCEPTDPELYEFVSTNYSNLRFSEPQKNIKLIVKRKNYKRVAREVRKELEKPTNEKKESLAQETLRIELEKNKKIKNKLSKAQKEAIQEEKFMLRQEKKKKKKRGH